MVEQAQRVHSRGIKDDAVKMWGELEGVHMQKFTPLLLVAIPDTVFNLGEESDEDDHTTASLPLVPIPEVAEPPPLVPPQTVLSNFLL